MYLIDMWILLEIDKDNSIEVLEQGQKHKLGKGKIGSSKNLVQI